MHLAEQFDLAFEIDERPAPFEAQHGEAAMILQIIMRAGKLELYFLDDGRVARRPALPPGEIRGKWKLVA